jgi:hypothetical protein
MEKNLFVIFEKYRHGRVIDEADKNLIQKLLEDGIMEKTLIVVMLFDDENPYRLERGVCLSFIGEELYYREKRRRSSGLISRIKNFLYNL